MKIDEIEKYHPKGQVNLSTYNILELLCRSDHPERLEFSKIENAFIDLNKNHKTEDFIWWEMWHGYDYTNHLKIINHYCEKLNINKSRFYFYIGDLNIKKYENFDFNIIPNLFIFRAYFYGYEDHQIFKSINFNFNKKIYLQGGRESESRNYLKKEFENLNINFIHTISNSKLDGGGEKLDTDELFNFFNDSFLYVVTESNEVNLENNIKNRNNFYFTEKTAIPLSSYRPFIIVGGYGYIDWLKKLGFKTFDKWWDESYQYSETLQEQIDSVLKIIKKINTYSIEELVKIKKEMEDVLIHNQKMFLHYIKNPILNL